MTKRFKHSEIIQDDGQTICYGIEDTQTRHIFNVIGDGIYDVTEKELIKLLNELYEDLNHELTVSKALRDVVKELEKENEQLKKENYELHKRLGDFEPFEEHIQERTSKTSLEDIIGIVKTDEPTNSVELKKELYK